MMMLRETAERKSGFRINILNTVQDGIVKRMETVGSVVSETKKETFH